MIPNVSRGEPTTLGSHLPCCDLRRSLPEAVGPDYEFRPAKWRKATAENRATQQKGEASMKFLGHWRIPHDNWLPVLKKFTSMSPQEQKNAGDGVTIVGRWHDVAARTGVVVFEASDAAAVQRYLGHWNPYMEIDLVPVLDDEESTAVYRQILAINNA